MVRQNYLHRLALGRSAFEPPIWVEERSLNRPSRDFQRDGALSGEDSIGEYAQRYDSRGHPQNLASRAQVRRNIRAHNEVLATVDVCARIDSAGRDIGKFGSRGPSEVSHDASIIEENETGLWIGFADDLFCLIATTFTANLRRRIETFDFYAGLPLLTVSRIELSHLGLFEFFFAGEAANTAFYILDTSLDTFIEIGRDCLLERFSTINHTDSERLRNANLVRMAERGLKTVSFCALFPLQLYAALQRLSLLPAWPMLPNPFHFSYFLPILQSLSPIWGSGTVRKCALSLITSPIVSYLAMYHFTDRLKIKLSAYSRATILRPDNPDNASYKLGVGQDQDAPGGAPVLDYPKYQGSLGQELQKDVQSILERFAGLRQRVRSNFRWFFNTQRPAVDFRDLTSRNSQAVDQNTPSFPNQRNRPESQSYQETLPVLVTAGSSTATPTSPLLTPTSSEEPELQVGEQTNVRIRTRTGSTSTLHMDVEFNAPERGGPIVTSSFAASPRPAIVEALLSPAAQREYDMLLGFESDALNTITEPHYRVTALTLHPSDALGSHLTGALVSLIRLPLESYYIRCLARSFITAKPVGSADVWLLRHVYPLRNWFGTGFQSTGWRGPVDYASKVLLCIGIEAFVTAEVWRLGCWVAWWAGRKWYSWGNL